MTNFKWYRRLKGGTWYYIHVRGTVGEAMFWTHTPGKDNRIITVETY